MSIKVKNKKKVVEEEVVEEQPKKKVKKSKKDAFGCRIGSIANRIGKFLRLTKKEVKMKDIQEELGLDQTHYNLMTKWIAEGHVERRDGNVFAVAGAPHVNGKAKKKKVKAQKAEPEDDDDEGDDEE